MRIALEGTAVAVFPVTVVGEYGDQRSGVIFSDATRADATRSACDVLAGQVEIHIKCVDEQTVTRSSLLAGLQKQYALGLNVSREALREVGEELGARYAVLFRPDAGLSGQAAQNRVEPRRPISDLSVERLMEPVPPQKSKRKANARSLVVSAVLLDLQRGLLLRRGVHSVRDPRTEHVNRSYDETPEAVALLADLLIELGEAMLADSNSAVARYP